MSSLVPPCLPLGQDPDFPPLQRAPPLPLVLLEVSLLKTKQTTQL